MVVCKFGRHFSVKSTWPGVLSRKREVWCQGLVNPISSRIWAGASAGEADRETGSGLLERQAFTPGLLLRPLKYSHHNRSRLFNKAFAWMPMHLNTTGRLKSVERLKGLSVVVLEPASPSLPPVPAVTDKTN